MSCLVERALHRMVLRQGGTDTLRGSEVSQLFRQNMQRGICAPLERRERRPLEHRRLSRGYFHEKRERISRRGSTLLFSLLPIQTLLPSVKLASLGSSFLSLGAAVSLYDALAGEALHIRPVPGSALCGSTRGGNGMPRLRAWCIPSPVF